MGAEFAVESVIEAELHGFLIASLYDAKSWLLDVQLLPFYVTGGSVVVLLLQIAYSAKKVSVVAKEPTETVQSQPGNAFKKYTRAHGNITILSFMALRFIACLAMLGLSVATSLQKSGEDGMLSLWDEWKQWSLPMSFLYTSITSGISLFHNRWSTTVSHHTIFVLLVIFGVYAYRDLWPLVIVNGIPQDIAEGPFLWAKLIVVTIAAVLIPLFIPRRYVPLDPTEPMEEPNPEQTASIFSFLLYFFLDGIIFKASGVEHLAYAELPPLADYDHAKYLKETGFRHLDSFAGAKPRHLAFRLLRVFRWEYALLIVNVIIQVIATFGAPLGINGILRYLEHGPSSTGVQPWFWIGWLFVGPMAFSLSRQGYIFMTTHMLLVQRVCSATGTASEGPQTKKPVARTVNIIGKMNNLITTDVNYITEARDFLIVKILLTTTFSTLYSIANSPWYPVSLEYGLNCKNYSAFIGLFTMIAMFPLSRYVMKKLGTLQKEKMKLTDARVQTVTETVNVLRMVKMFAWELKMAERLCQDRDNELRVLWKRKVYNLMSNMINFIISTLMMLSTFAFYTLVMKQQLSAAKVFSSTPVFNLIRIQLFMFSGLVNRMIQGKVALDRIDEFLQNTELLDSYASANKDLNEIEHDSGVIGFKTAAYSRGVVLQERMHQLNYRANWHRENIDIDGFARYYTAPGEMHFIPSAPGAWFNLPRDGGVAYAAQESWVQNDTIQNNILFGSSFDETRYNKELFEAGDQTEVGERGLTLSGGQKARVTLARAIYSSAEIILLDDVLAALDAHTWIVEECLLGDLVKGRTVLLVTHNVALTLPIAHFVAEVGVNGRISTETLAPLDHLPSDILHIIEDIPIDDSTVKAEENEPKSTKHDGKLILAEEIAKGRVGWKAMKLFLSALGGKFPVAFLVLWMFGCVCTDAATTSKHGTLAIGGRNTRQVVLYKRHRSTLRWLDETPVSRIIARCTQDIRAVDDPLAAAWSGVVELIVTCLVRLGSVVIITPAFLVPGLAVVVIGSWAASIYLRAQLSVKREMSNAKAPLLAHFGATVAGIVSVRAYGAQHASKQKLMTRTDHYTRVARVSYNLNRWIAVRMDLLGALFTTSLATYLVRTRNASASNTGFSLTVALDFCLTILWWVRQYNEFEVQSNRHVHCYMDLLDLLKQHISLERIQSYIDIDHEKPASEAGKPPAVWPASGDLRVENLSARYSANSPEVLHQLSFQIRSGERVGVVNDWAQLLQTIVGRTGSGKSTLTLALLRCILTEGAVYYDGMATDQINLDALRSNITIIPQVPELLSGTLRRNLDPFEEHDDAELNAALKYAGLFSLQNDSDEIRITLDTKIASAGSNLSVGQRQIIALARAMVRESKLLILDEATSAIDYKTDALIQDALRSKLSSDVTVITIAHRLETIMDADKIMVLDAGKLVEFDTPAALLQKKDGVFTHLVDNSGDSAALRAVAFGKTRR
ncbi:hypothetical protein BDQ17DRAFT_1321012 [Cyathus striatus]|nr:hypothetical protein BDQ17DRAFT_1321012 [Cyathus striatus]